MLVLVLQLQVKTWLPTKGFLLQARLHVAGDGGAGGVDQAAEICPGAVDGGLAFL